jgi:hypothetical protein
MSEATHARGEPQTAAAVLVVRPASFASNPQTLATNAFQAAALESQEIAAAAQSELDALVVQLAAAGVRVHAFAGVGLPDEVFPNNWISTHADGTAVLYPMLAENRRRERRRDIVEALRRDYRITRVVDLARLEAADRYLEGTGSVILDRPQRVAYAALSSRTNRAALDELARELGYESVAFATADRAGQPIYHTNVLLSIGTRFAVICAAAIGDAAERKRVLERLGAGREIIELSFDELHAFAGNVLALAGRDGEVLALSAGALAALGAKRALLERHAELVVADVPTIERYGGGGVRCMLAEVHLPPLARARTAHQ